MKKVTSDKEQRNFIQTTIGMMRNHKNLNRPVLIKCHVYEALGDIELHAVSGHNLARIKQIPTVILSKQEWEDRDYDLYDDQEEFFWLTDKLGCF